MKYLAEYRDGTIARALAAQIRRTATRRWVLMEVCGGQTHTIVKQGLDELLGDAVEMIHGPGCPVCVTPLEQIDKALALAARPEVIFTSFGDMLRVPGTDVVFNSSSSGYPFVFKRDGARYALGIAPPGYKGLPLVLESDLRPLLVAEEDATRIRERLLAGEC